MASNMSIRKQIKELDSEVDTSELNKDQLTALLENLKNPKKKEGITLPGMAPKVKGPQFTVAPGKTLVAGKRGMIHGGEEVKAAWLAEGDNGIDALKNHLESGAVDRNWE